MDHSSYFQVLKDTSDLLVERYALQYSTLYWKNESGQFDTVASFSTENRDKKNVSIPFSLSRSLIGAIRKTVFIPNTVRDLTSIDEKPDQEEAYLLVVVPLKKDSIHGMLAMWCKTDQHKMNQEDRVLLDFAGSSILKNLEVYPTLSLQNKGKDSFQDQDGETVSVKLEDAELKGLLASQSENDVPPLDEGTSESLREEIDYIQYSSQGFIAFNKDCQVIYSNPDRLKTIFEQDISGMSALDILFKLGIPSNPESTSFSVNPKESNIYDLLTTIFMRITDLDVMIELLPSEIDIKGNFYRVEYSYVKAQKEENDSILMIFHDISKEKKLQYQSEIENSRSNMISKVAMDTSGYIQTRETIVELLDKVIEEFSNPVSDRIIKNITHQLRTVQMGVDIYDVKDISDQSQKLIEALDQRAHNLSLSVEERESYQRDVETLKDLLITIENSYLSTFFSENSISSSNSYQVTDAKLQSIYKTFATSGIDKTLKEMETIFENNYRPFTRLPRLSQITNQRLERVKENLWKKVGTPCKNSLKELLDSIKTEPIRQFFDRYAIVAENLAQKHNKQVEVKQIGDEIELPTAQFEALFSSLIHVVRNSVEHGIEKMEERVFYDKELEGVLTFEAKVEEGTLSLKLADDGKGIDIEKIKQTAITCNIITTEEAENISQEDALQLIFKLGARSDDTSGSDVIRGIGLDIVRQNVEKLDGHIQIYTEPEKGTTIKISVPLESV